LNQPLTLDSPAPLPSIEVSGHPLDNVIWNALATGQASLARGDALARRFDPAFARFAALAQPTPAALDRLARYVAPGEDVGLFLLGELEPGDHFKPMGRLQLTQMIGPPTGEPADPSRFVVLQEGDKAQMADLVARTEPGPWAARTAEMGRFVGMKVDGRLVAMAGERLRPPGHVEISGVCTDPAWRGKGLARDLMLVVAQGILARGAVPFLHVLSENATAIQLYQRMGFVERARWQVALLRRNERAAP